MPKMQYVDSSSLAAIGYDSETRELRVRFRESGETYAYYESKNGSSTK